MTATWKKQFSHLSHSIRRFENIKQSWRELENKNLHERNMSWFNDVIECEANENISRLALCKHLQITLCTRDWMEKAAESLWRAFSFFINSFLLSLTEWRWDTCCCIYRRKGVAGSFISLLLSLTRAFRCGDYFCRKNCGAKFFNIF